jgi:hypothetical protein
LQMWFSLYLLLVAVPLGLNLERANSAFGVLGQPFQ